MPEKRMLRRPKSSNWQLAISHTNPITPSLSSAVDCSLQEVSLSGLAMELVSFHQHAASGEHYVRHAFDLDAFEHRVVHAHVMGLGADGMFTVGIEDHQVGVAANCNGAFTRVEAKDFRRSRRNKLHKTVHAEAPFADSAGIDQAHAMFNAWTSVGNFGEVVFSHLLLLFEAERAMIGGDHLQVVLLKAVPKFFLVPFLAQRRRKDVFGALKSGLVHVIQ